MGKCPFWSLGELCRDGLDLLLDGMKFSFGASTRCLGFGLVLISHGAFRSVVFLGLGERFGTLFLVRNRFRVRLVTFVLL